MMSVPSPIPHRVAVGQGMSCCPTYLSRPRYRGAWWSHQGHCVVRNFDPRSEGIKLIRSPPHRVKPLLRTRVMWIYKRPGQSCNTRKSITNRKQIFHPVFNFVFSSDIFVFKIKGTISLGCILKQGYKVSAPNMWWRQAIISPGYSPEPGLKVLYSRLEAPAGTKGWPLVLALGYNRDKIFLDKII